MGAACPRASLSDHAAAVLPSQAMTTQLVLLLFIASSALGFRFGARG
jgi:hypothetical protein